jgi:hypothetical protein
MGAILAITLLLVGIFPVRAAQEETAASGGEEIPTETVAEGDGDSSDEPGEPEEQQKEELGHGGAPLAPPDGNWLVDEEGREYFVYPLPRRGQMSFQGPDRVQISYGLTFDLVGYDDETLYVKIYNTEGLRTTRPRSELTEEERAEILATYVVETEESHSLRYHDFDQGLPRQGQWRQGFAVGDMNGDGHADIVHGPARKSGTPPVIFLGDGAGGWQIWKDTVFPRVTFDYGDALAADFSGDGVLDLAFGMHLLGALALEGDGQGGFQAWTEGIGYDPTGKKNPPPLSSRALASGDMNGDGKVDLVVLSDGPRGFEHVDFSTSYGKVVYLNQGDGTWTPKRLEEAERVFGDAIVVADMDGDGVLDFVTASRSRGYRAILNRGLGDGLWEPMEVDALRPLASTPGIDVEDLDGDDHLDLALSYQVFQAEAWRSGIDILYNRGDGGWERRPLEAQETKSIISDLDIGDLDGDGVWDLVAGTWDGAVLVYRGDGQGFFTRESASPLAAPTPTCRAYSVGLANLDGKPGDEIVAGFAGDDCPRGGSLRAWRVEAIDEIPAQTPANEKDSPGA